MVGQLETLEEYHDLQEEQAEAHGTQEQAYSLILQKLQQLENEKTELEMSKLELQDRLDTVLSAQDSIALGNERNTTPANGNHRLDDSVNQSACTTPRSLIADVVQAAYLATQDITPTVPTAVPPSTDSPKSVSLSPKTRSTGGDASPLKDRRKSTGSTVTERSKIAKEAKAIERSFRKPSVPKQEEIRKSLRQLASPTRRLSNPTNACAAAAAAQTDSSTLCPLTTPRGDRKKIAATAAYGYTPKVIEKDKPASGIARVSLRKRMEDHHAQQLQRQQQYHSARKHDPDNNPWLGAYSTNSRASQGGCQFFVDLVADQLDSPSRGAYSPRNGSRSLPTETSVSAAMGGAAMEDYADGGTSTAAATVELLRMESADMQDLLSVSNSNNASFIATQNAHEEGDECAADDVLDTDSLDGDSDKNHEKSSQGDGSTRLHSGSTATGSLVPASPSGAASSLPGSPSSRSNKQIMLDVKRYKRQINALQNQLADQRSQNLPRTQSTEVHYEASTARIHHVEVHQEHVSDVSLLASIEHDSSLHNASFPDLKAIPSSGANADGKVGDFDVCVDVDKMFIELVDAAVQCDEIPYNLAPPSVQPAQSMLSVGTNTDNVVLSTCGTSTSSLHDSQQLPLTIGSPGSPHNRLLSFALEPVQAQGTFGPSTPRSVPEVRCTPEDALLMKNIENSKFQLGKKLFEMCYGTNNKPAGYAQNRANVSKGTEGRSTSSGPPQASVPTTKPVAAGAAVDTAVQRTILSETLQMNSTLIGRLKHQQKVADRTQRKIDLLEEKLCRLIMFIKASARAGTGFASLRDDAAVQSAQPAPVDVVPAAPAAPAPAPLLHPSANSPSKASPQRHSKQVTSSASPVQRAHTRFADTPVANEVPDTPQHTSCARNTTAQQEQQLRVGNMSFGAGLEELLCFSEGDVSDEENSRNAVINKSLFSPDKDFQGRNYDDLEESKVSSVSNPLLQSAIHNISNRPHDHEHEQEQSRMEISFNNDTSFFDMPQMESLGERHAEIAMFSPISVRKSNDFDPPRQSASSRTSTAHSIELGGPVSIQQQQLQPKPSTINTAGRPSEIGSAGTAGKSADDLRKELFQAHRNAQKLEQQVEQLNLRNKVNIRT